ERGFRIVGADGLKEAEMRVVFAAAPPRGIVEHLASSDGDQRRELADYETITGKSGDGVREVEVDKATLAGQKQISFKDDGLSDGFGGVRMNVDGGPLL